MLPRVEHAWDLTPREAAAFQSTLAIPVLLPAFAGLLGVVDLLVVDGQGYAHPRRMGVACHLGLIFDIPTIGCAKSKVIGEHDRPGERRGSVAYLRDSKRWNETIGAAVRTREGTNPVCVSVGHRISLDEAIEWTLPLSPQYRVPMPNEARAPGRGG
jgi:deoxyribonuclease V